MNTTLTSRTANRAFALAASALLVFGASCTDDPVVRRVHVGRAAVEHASPSSHASTSTSRPRSTPVHVDRPPSTAPIGSSLTDEEIAGLMWMREEEQLAHDVYVVLGELWNLRIFDNISGAETAHIDAVSGLLDLYGLDDPAAGNDAGHLHRSRTPASLRPARGGRQSIAGGGAGGRRVHRGARHRRPRRTFRGHGHPEISAVYANLERGSRNHLRAFFSQLDSRGVTYEPTQLDPATFDAIVSSDIERGSGS